METSDFGKTKSPLFGKFDQVLVRLGSLLNDTRYDFLMKPKTRNSTESLTDLMQDLVGLGEPRANVTVLDLSAVPFDVVPMVTAQIDRELWQQVARQALQLYRKTHGDRAPAGWVPGLSRG